jgi:hypothetical protein
MFWSENSCKTSERWPQFTIPYSSRVHISFFLRQHDPISEFLFGCIPYIILYIYILLLLLLLFYYYCFIIIVLLLWLLLLLLLFYYYCFIIIIIIINYHYCYVLIKYIYIYIFFLHMHSYLPVQSSTFIFPLRWGDPTLDGPGGWRVRLRPGEQGAAFCFTPGQATMKHGETHGGYVIYSDLMGFNGIL